MKDNIVDFNSWKAIKSTAGNSKQVFNSLTEFLTSLPQNALMADVAERFAEQTSTRWPRTLKQKHSFTSCSE